MVQAIWLCNAIRRPSVTAWCMAWAWLGKRGMMRSCKPRRIEKEAALGLFGERCDKEVAHREGVVEHSFIAGDQGGAVHVERANGNKGSDSAMPQGSRGRTDRRETGPGKVKVQRGLAARGSLTTGWTVATAGPAGCAERPQKSQTTTAAKANSLL